MGPAEVGGRLYRVDIRLVIGTRPEAIKQAPVAHALARRGLKPSIILTGQHPQLELQSFGLGGFDAVNLRCPGQALPHDHVEAVRCALDGVLRSGPELLVVQGDTSSAMGGAIAGFGAGVSVAHVEAGLRSHDPRQPWPEEEYRRRIDGGAELLFAPTQAAAENLWREQVRGHVFVTGNTGIDALLAVEAALPPRQRKEAGKFKILVTCHRRENWGSGVQGLAEALARLASDTSLEIHLVQHPNPELSATLTQKLGSVAGIVLKPPCPHPDLVLAMRDCDLLLSDSGGMQEEAPALGTPLLVLRDKTERPEAIESGNMRLIGCHSDTIVDEVQRLRADPVALASMSRRAFPYGDGRAGKRIAGIIEGWIEQRSSSVRLTAAAG
ncbi:MAG: non-hydrolyzing UDP-N-acetylglucosamine 2-epimerase [Sphingomicrobium sp.]